MFIIPNDKTKNKWKKKHIQNLQMAKKMNIAGFKERAIRMIGCGSQIEVERCEKCGQVIFKKAILCRDRLCPTCAWRLSVKRFAEMMSVFNEIFKEHPELKASMLTLTVKNVPVSELKETCRNMSNAWKRLTQSKSFALKIIGYARSLEITINKRTLKTHPHLHILLIWGKNEDNNVFRERMKKMWRKTTNIDYDPIIDIRDAYSKDETDSAVKIALEGFKYAIKPNDFEKIPLKDFFEFANQIKGIRFISYGGIILNTRRKLKMLEKDTPSKEIEDIVIDNNACSHHWVKALAIWSNIKEDYEGIELDEQNTGNI